MIKYPKYKDSGIAWLREIPEHWEVRKLKYVAKCFPSNIDKHSKENEKEVRLCNYTDVYKNNFISNDMKLMIATAKDDQIEKFTLLKNDVIITKDSETADDIANPALVIEDLENIVCGYHLSVLRPYSNLFGGYLFRALQCKPINVQFELSSMGVTRVGLGVYDLKKAKIPLPPKTEQTAIANFLDYKLEKINRFIAKKKQLIELLKEQKAAIINKAVTQGINPNAKLNPSGIEWLGDIPEHWEVRRLGSFGKFSKGGGISRAELVEKGIAAILYGDIYTKYTVKAVNIINRIGEETAENSIELEVGDLLFTGSGETKEDIGKCIVCLSEESTYAGGDVIIFKQNEFDSLFLSYSLNSNSSVYQKARTAKGDIIVHTYGSKLRNVYIPLPLSTKEQSQIVQYIETESTKIHKTTATIEKEIALVEEYKTALISEAVTGKIDVRKWSEP